MTIDLDNNSPYTRVFMVALDQLVAASSNFLVVWVCLTSLPSEDFGSFSYSWSTIALFVVLSRAMFGIPALLDSGTKDPDKAVDMSSSLTGTLVLGILAALVTFCLYFVSGQNESEIWILALFLLAPVILLQDQFRYLLIATKSTKFALSLDLLVLSCVLITVIAAKITTFVGWQLILGLASGYTLASLIFLTKISIKVSLRKLKQYINLDFYRRSRLVNDALLTWGFGLIAITVIRTATGDSGMAVYNGLVFLFGPVVLVTVFLTLGMQSEVVRTKGYLASRHKVVLALVSAIPILWLLIIKGLPDIYLEVLLGTSAQLILASSLPFGIAASLGIGLEVLNLFMRAHMKFAQIAILRLFVGIVSTTCITVAMYLALGLDTIIWTLAATNCLAILLTSMILQKDSISKKT